MRSNRPPLILPLALVIVGVALLLHNYLLLDAVDILRFWPVLLIAAGAQLLLRGDIGFTWQAQTFGITRGNVQSAALQASSGEIDVKLRALRREGRLIAGQYTARSRPALGVRGTHARLTLQRGQTWLLSLADWEIGLAHDLPYLASGIGDVRVVVSDAAPLNVLARSTFGNVTLVIPPDVPAVIHIEAGPIARVQIDETRFLLLEPGVYATVGYDRADTSVQATLATLNSTLGTVRLM